MTPDELYALYCNAWARNANRTSGPDARAHDGSIECHVVIALATIDSSEPRLELRNKPSTLQQIQRLLDPERS